MQRVNARRAQALHQYFLAASQEASLATCKQARCGSVIISSDGDIIGRGHNAPVLGEEDQRMCDKVWDYTKKPKYDLTCCVHAEWNAVLDACKNYPGKLTGSTLYFMRINGVGNFTNVGLPYSMTCSRFVTQAGVSKFALWNDGGADIYDLGEYNLLSYDFYKA